MHRWFKPKRDPGRPRQVPGEGAPNGHGYLRVTTDTPQGPKRVYLHRHLAGLADGEQSAESLVVDHINGNRLDNSPENLEVVTKAENTRRSNRKRAKG